MSFWLVPLEKFFKKSVLIISLLFLTGLVQNLVLVKPALATNSGPFTAEAWVYPTGSVTSKAIIGKANELRVYVDGSGLPSCQIMVSSAWQTAAAGTTALSLNTWSHVACSYDKVTLRLFVNGAQVGTQALTTAPDDTSNVFRLGQDDSSGTTYANLAGTVDEFKFYNYGRTSKQIVEDMNAGHPAPGSPVGSAVGWWKFDEGQGTTAHDASVNSNSLTLSAASWTNSGKFGKAWNGDGTKWLSRADDSDFDFAAADDASISVWFKSDSATNPSATEYLVDKESSSAGYAIYANTDGTVCFGIDDDATWTPDDSACTTSDIYDATWHHLVATKIGTTEIRLYVDGVSKGSDTSIAATGTLANSASLYVGDRDGSDNGNEFNGDLDELKIYRGALSLDEVRVEYNRSSAMVLGALSDNSSYQKTAANQEYCVPGDATSCAAPVAEWKMDEGSGTSANDTSGNANTGTLGTGNSAPTWTTGKIGKGLNFDGTDDVVDMGDIAQADGGSGLTVSFWAKQASLGTDQTFIAKWDFSTQGSWALQTDRTDNTRLKFFIATSLTDDGTGYNIKTPVNSWTAGAWHHIVLSYPGSAATVYIDGVSQTLTTTGTAPSSMQNSTATLKVGKFGGTLSRFFNGTIDQVRIFNYARTAAQVAWDYNRGGPVGWWKMDECQGSTAYDASGNANNGTITVGASGTQTAVGDCTTSATTMWNAGATGKFNSSLNFDGTDDYINIADSAALTPGSNASWSVSVWAKPPDSNQNAPIITKRLVTSPFTGWSLYVCGTGGCGGSGQQLDGFYLGSSGVNRQSLSTKDVADGNWHQYIMVADQSANKVKLYMDGAELATTLTNNGAWPGPNNTDPVRIANNNSTGYFSGQIDDVRIYNYALTAKQIKLLYNENAAVRFGPSTGQP